jgi:hypothetical protein
MQKGSWVRTLYYGDVSFSNFDVDVQTLSTKFGEAICYHLTVIQFKLDFASAVRKSSGHQPYWRTVLTDVPVNFGEVGHFEVPHDSGSMIGGMEGSNNCSVNAYIGRDGNEHGKGMYLSNKSLYSRNLNDKREFAFVQIKHGDTVGIFLDMRERDNGRMFFTHNGAVVGQMYKSLVAPVYPAISHGHTDHSHIESIFLVSNKHPLPTGWDNPQFRDDEYRAKVNKPFL